MQNSDEVSDSNSEEIILDDEDTCDPNEPVPDAVYQDPFIVVSAEDAAKRLDHFIVSKRPELTRSAVQRLLESPTAYHGILVNGHASKPAYKLRTGDKIEISVPDATPSRALPEKIALDVVYEDSSLIVINKPRGMVVHPAPGTPNGTLVNAVLAHCSTLSGIGGVMRPGIVHRLDKDTGGLIVVAKTDQAHQSLQSQIQAKTAERRYISLIWGQPTFHQAEVNAPIGRHPTDRKKMAVVTDPRYTARTATTIFTVQNSWWGTLSMLECKLLTGRTHQIRVHSAYIHHPIVGDTTYGGIRRLPVRMEGLTPTQVQLLQSAIDGLNGQALQAYHLSFDHPTTGERLAFTVPPARRMQKLISLLEELHAVE